MARVMETGAHFPEKRRTRWRGKMLPLGVQLFERENQKKATNCIQQSFVAIPFPSRHKCRCLCLRSENRPIWRNSVFFLKIHNMVDATQDAGLGLGEMITFLALAHMLDASQLVTVRKRTLISAAFWGSGFERFRTAQGLFAQWFLDMATKWVYNFGDGKERG